MKSIVVTNRLTLSFTIEWQEDVYRQKSKIEKKNSKICNNKIKYDGQCELNCDPEHRSSFFYPLLSIFFSGARSKLYNKIENIFTNALRCLHALAFCTFSESFVYIFF